MNVDIGIAAQILVTRDDIMAADRAAELGRSVH
jgi:hypothetical protein